MKVLEWIDAGIFPRVVLFSYGFEYDELIQELKKKRKTKEWYEGIKDDKEWFDNGRSFASKRVVEDAKKGTEKTCLYILLKDEFKFTDDDYITLSHEVLHICQYMLSDLLKRDREHECEAYLHSYLMEQCLKVIRETVK